jgi:hypothetical protein
MNKWIEKLFGIDKIRAEAERSISIAAEASETAKAATEAAERATEAEAQAKLSPKERATRKKEPWVGVLMSIKIMCVMAFLSLTGTTFLC